MMKREVVTYNSIEGFHKWPGAPAGLEYLAARHRHLFEIRCRFTVTHNDREIEINRQQNTIEGFLVSHFGRPCEFEEMSCESIAEVIMNRFGESCVSCQVLEDGYGGASLTR